MSDPKLSPNPESEEEPAILLADAAVATLARAVGAGMERGSEIVTDTPAPAAPKKYEIVERLIGPLMALDIPAGRTWVKPYYTRQKYRDKWRWVVGYSWKRPYANPYTGMLKVCVLGYGNTFEEAAERAKVRIEKTVQR